MPTTEKIMFWNVQNLFRGSEFSWTSEPDKSLAEQAHADRGATFNTRIALLAERIANFSGSATGPGVLGLAELEMSPVTLGLVRDRLNIELGTTYTLCYRKVRSNRAICTALFTRWTVVSTSIISTKWRVIEVKLTQGGTTICIYVCHWPSRVSDPDGEARKDIAEKIYRQVVALGSGARVIVMGDFNDTPTDPSITTYLKAGSDEAAAVASTHPNLILYNCMTAGHLAGGITHFHDGPQLWHGGAGVILDHICCTGTLLGTANPKIDSTSTAIYTTGINQGGRPWRFNYDGAGGYSDHFPIGVSITWT